VILILGTSGFEQGTNPVVDWLIHLGANFTKITTEDLFIIRKKIEISLNQQKIIYKKTCLNDNVSVVWYRHFLQPQEVVSKNDSKFYNQINNETHSDIRYFTELIYEFLKDKKWVSPYPSTYLNKLTVLNRAAEFELKVPKSKILNRKTDILIFLQGCRSDSLIVKQFSDRSRGYYVDGAKTYFSLAKSLYKDDILNLEDNMFPTLFQEKINTHFEIRVFYIDGKLFASAILCDAGYNTDDRKKIMSQSNIHVIPYALPEILKENIAKFMHSMNLAMGAIDLIKCKSGEYYFLEVNPIGQYLYESEKCNFHIEKHIAEYLIALDEK